jgi:tetratricopeptide (TPR) repeat protein
VRAAVQVAIVAGDYVDALRRIDAAPGELFVDSQHVYWPKSLMLGRVHALAGDTDRARESYRTARDLLERRVRERPQDERIASALGLVYAGLGRKEDAIREELRGVELLPYEKEALRGAQRIRELAQIYTRVGEPDLAIDRLEFLLGRPGFDSRRYLKLDPTWTPLRNHPRFQQLVEQ